MSSLYRSGSAAVDDAAAVGEQHGWVHPARPAVQSISWTPDSAGGLLRELHLFVTNCSTQPFAGRHALSDSLLSVAAAAAAAASLYHAASLTSSRSRTAELRQSIQFARNIAFVNDSLVIFSYSLFIFYPPEW